MLHLDSPVTLQQSEHSEHYQDPPLALSSVLWLPEGAECINLGRLNVTYPPGSALGVRDSAQHSRGVSVFFVFLVYLCLLFFCIHHITLVTQCLNCYYYY